VRALVTGGAGFIGGHLVRRWVEDRPDLEVVVVDACTYAADPDALDDLGGVRLERVDIADAAAVDRIVAELRPDVVVNLAAESHNSLAVLEPARFVRTNVLGTQALIDACLRHDVARFHQVSTCEVYGDLPLDGTHRFRPDEPYRPHTPYSASKAAADHLVRAAHHAFGLPATISVGANTYGPRQFPEKAVPLFCTHALSGRALPVYASSEHRREWIHVDDHVAAVLAVVERGRPGQAYHVGSGVERSVRELVDRILALTGGGPELITVVPDRPGHDRRYLLDSDATTAELGWSPLVGFDEGLADTVSWYREHPDWWKPRLDAGPVDEFARGTRPA
jgi:dTDP-glucose 4,6-dehydratase